MLTGVQSSIALRFETTNFRVKGTVNDEVVVLSGIAVMLEQGVETPCSSPLFHSIGTAEGVHGSVRLTTTTL